MDLRIDVRGGGSGEKAFSMLTETWLEGPAKRRELLEPLRELVEGPAPPLEEGDVLRAAGPAMTVLGQGMDGIELTKTGAFSPAFAKRMADEHPRWAHGADPAAIHREADLPMLRDLRAILEDSGFMRRQGRVAFTSENAAEMMEQSPTALLTALGCEVVWDQGFASHTGELCAAALLHGEPLDTDRLADRIHPVMAEFCHSGDHPLDAKATRLATALWLELTASVGAIPDFYLADMRAQGEGWPLPVGPLARACLIAILRFRVLRSTLLMR